MPEILLVTEQELRRGIGLDKTAIDIIDHAFARLDEGEVIMPPVLSMEMPMVNGEVDVKTAYVPGVDSFTIKVSPGFFDNPLKGLTSLNGLMIVFDAQTGLVRAVLLDNGYLTDIRTAAAGGVAARHLAPRRVDTAGVVGAGVQARLQAKALLLERDVKLLQVWARSPQSADACAMEMHQELGIPVQRVESLETLVRSSQVVITTTPAKQALIDAAWVHPGLHISAMGSDSPEKNELDPLILKQADRFVVDRVSQSLERGEMRSAVKAGILSSEFIPTEIGALCRGVAPGRQSDDEVTVCDLTGTGVQDTAIADYTLKIVKQHDLGTTIDA